MLNWNNCKDGLFHPERLTVFEGHQDEWQWETDDNFSWTKAWWLCQLCHLAYYDEADSQDILKIFGLQLEAFIDDRNMPDAKGKFIKDTQAYILSLDSAVFLVFRGTEPDIYQDYLTDAYFRPQEWSGKGRVHAGFYGALNGASWDLIESTLQQPHLQAKPLWITGHSLGGALATVAAAKLKPHALYHFGSPRVGDEAFGSHFNDFQVHRFANCADVVTHVPFKNMLGYQHIGQLHYFDRYSRYQSQFSERQQLIDQWIAKLIYPFQYRVLPFSSKLFLRALADHNVVNYAFAIRQQL